MSWKAVKTIGNAKACANMIEISTVLISKSILVLRYNPSQLCGEDKHNGKHYNYV